MENVSVWEQHDFKKYIFLAYLFFQLSSFPVTKSLFTAARHPRQAGEFRFRDEPSFCKNVVSPKIKDVY